MNTLNVMALSASYGFTCNTKEPCPLCTQPLGATDRLWTIMKWNSAKDYDHMLVHELCAQEATLLEGKDW